MVDSGETRKRIIAAAMRQASLVGLGQLTLGALAKQLKLSKSGLFAHFGSKEQLQLAVLEETRALFISKAMLPAFKKPRGEARVLALAKKWLDWATSDLMPGGCVFVSAAAEFDKQPGAIRDRVRKTQQEFFEALCRATAISIEEQHFRQDVDVRAFALSLQGILLATHEHQHLLESSQCARDAGAALEMLLAGARVSKSR